MRLAWAPLLAPLCFLVLVEGPRHAHGEGQEACVEVKDFGCYYPADTDPKSPDLGLLIFMRGHCFTWGDDHCPGDYGGVVPPDKLTESARRMFDYGKLGEAARSRGLAVLVSGSSHKSLDKATLDALQAQTGSKFARLTLAAHSGGYAGLLKTIYEGLAGLPKLERVIFLDNFYFAAQQASDLQDKIGGAGASCRGFYTDQPPSALLGKADYGNNVRNYIAPALSSCKIENHNDWGHTEGVPGCLKYYLADMSCPAKEEKNPPALPPPPAVDGPKTIKNVMSVYNKVTGQWEGVEPDGSPNGVPSEEQPGKPKEQKKAHDVFSVVAKKRPLDEGPVPALAVASASPQSAQPPRGGGCDYNR